MGLKQSRAEIFPEIVNTKEFRDTIISQWNIDTIVDSSLNNPQCVQDCTTLHASILQIAGNKIKTFFNNTYPELKLNVLDIMCGNCAASKMIFDEIADLTTQWISTDIINWNKNNIPELFVFEQMNTVDSIVKFGLQSNVLLIVSPPPAHLNTQKINECSGFGDYFACYDFIAQTLECKQQKFIIFVGELGASDGTEGMYNYMNTHPNLLLIERSMVHIRPSVSGDNVEKELFVYEIHQ